MAKANTILIDVVPRLLGDQLGGQVVAMASKTTKALAGPMNAAVNAAGLAVLAGLAVALTAGSAAAIKFEDAFAMVKKTMAEVDDPEVFDEIAKDLMSLATTIPVTANELAGIASVAGQLGVAADDVAVFTEVAAKLGIATNMTSTQAATGLARFLNVTNNTTDEVGKFGSVLVQLGNNVAATESEILLLAQNFGATGNVAGLAAEDILAYSAATRAAGVQAAAGSTALGKLFMNVSNAVKEGDFEKLSVLNRMVGGDFKKAFEEDGALAVQQFLEGLSAMAKSGESVTPVLQKLGLNNVRTSRAVLSLANNNKGLAEAIKLARDETMVSNALNAEVATRMDTVSSKVQQLKSAFNALLIPLGNVFLPVFKSILDFLINVVNGFLGLQRVFEQLHGVVKGFIAVLAGATGLGPILKGLTSLFTKLTGVLKGKAGAEGVLGKVLQIFKNLAPFIKKAFLPITAIIAALSELGKRERIIRDFEKNVESMANTFMDIDAGGENFAERFNEEVFQGIIEGLPESMQEGVNAAVKEGILTEEGLEASKSIADGLSQGVVDGLRNLTDTGDLLFANVNVDELIESLRAEGLSEDSEILKIAVEINELKDSSNLKDIERVQLLKEALAVQTLFIEGERANLSLDERLSMVFREVLSLQELQEHRTKNLMSTEEGRVKLAQELAGEHKEIEELLIRYGLLLEEVAELTPIQKAIEQANQLKEMVDNIFLGSELNFAKQFADLDLTEAKQEQLDLEQEELDLLTEEVDLAQELIDLNNSQVETAEEILEQQELINEALEIEQRLRDGFALSANQQLRREKLRKDLRRVELAAAQGSLEFADLEKAKIKEDIEAIEDKALTQADADKLRADAAEISQKAEVRRQEEIADIEDRRIKIGERLAELPREQLEAQAAVLDAQKAIIHANLDAIIAMEQLGNATVQQAQRMAQALKLPANAIAAISSGSLSSQSAIANFSSQYGLNPGGQYTTLSQAQAPFLNAKRLLNPTSVAGSAGMPNSANFPSGNNQTFNNTINQNGLLYSDNQLLAKATSIITQQQIKQQRMGGGDLIR